MLASYNGHVEVVDKLLQHGATADLQTNVMTTQYSCYLLNFLHFEHTIISCSSALYRMGGIH